MMLVLSNDVFCCGVNSFLRLESSQIPQIRRKKGEIALKIPHRILEKSGDIQAGNPPSRTQANLHCNSAKTVLKAHTTASIE
jgi:hypothetical protein